MGHGQRQPSRELEYQPIGTTRKRSLSALAIERSLS